MPKLSKAQKKKAALALLPRCLSVCGQYVCERELGHGNGWNGDKHKSGGFSWTDAYARKVLEEQVKSSWYFFGTKVLLHPTSLCLIIVTVRRNQVDKANRLINGTTVILTLAGLVACFAALFGGF